MLQPVNQSRRSRSGVAPWSWWAILSLIILGTLVRLYLAFHFFGVFEDMTAILEVRQALRGNWLHVYSLVNRTTSEYGFTIFRWPYAPGFFPFILAAGKLSTITHTAIYGWVKLPAIAADAALALIVQDGLRRRGGIDSSRVAAVGLIAVGLPFVVISGYHGQIDSLSILPAVGAMVIWTGRRRNSWLCGGLIGCAGTIKPAPFLVLFALLPTASWRQRVALSGSAVAVLGLSLLPFALADPTGVSHLRQFSGLPGFGGVSLLAQPDLADVWINGVGHRLSSLSIGLLRHGSLLSGIGLLVVVAWVWHRRAQPVEAAVILWLAFYVLATGFAFQYLIWGIPFFLLAGHVRLVAALELVIAVPMFVLYVHPHIPNDVWVYVALMAVVWAGFLVAFGRSAAQTAAASVLPMSRST